MRYGCCVNMVTQTTDVSGIDIVPILKEIGYDYAELSLTHLCAMDDVCFKQVKDELLRIGLPIESCNNFFPPSMALTGDSVDFGAIKNYLELAFNRASGLGVKTIVFGSGAARMIRNKVTYLEAIEQLVEILKLVNTYAIKFNITIAIEPLRKQECNIINTYCEGMILADIADASNVKCLLDNYHLHEEREDISVIRKNPERLAHVHFAEPEGRVFPIEVNKQVYKSILKQIRQTGYNQRISIEAYSSDFRYDASKALRLLKEIETEIEFIN